MNWIRRTTNGYYLGWYEDCSSETSRQTVRDDSCDFPVMFYFQMWEFSSHLWWDVSDSHIWCTADAMSGPLSPPADSNLSLPSHSIEVDTNTGKHTQLERKGGVMTQEWLLHYALYPPMGFKLDFFPLIVAYNMRPQLWSVYLHPMGVCCLAFCE